ncbi:hypothetical protein VTK56DRAFT_9976 [Thermocarpiscus australiensis]
MLASTPTGRPAVTDPSRHWNAGPVRASSISDSGGPGLDAAHRTWLPTKFVENPPNLDEWRQRLFHLEEPLILTKEEVETYFPWVDNVYTHQGTQRYQRNRFVTHYYHCYLSPRRLPRPGKSDGTNKRKRGLVARVARERDLCGVKIKITEHAAGSGSELRPGVDVDMDSSALAEALARVQGQPFWLLRRIDSNGMNIDPVDGKPARHTHTLEKSDEIKKNSVQRWLDACGIEPKRSQKPPSWRPMGIAAKTAKKHAKEAGIKFFSASFCPFSQRVWIALEAKGLDYQYCETYPLSTPKPAQLLEVNPRGLVPAILEGGWRCTESSVILEYLEDIDSTVKLHPPNSRMKAECRFWIDFINRRIVPSFYNVLAAPEGESRARGIEQLQRDILELVQAADWEGPYFLADRLCLVDIHLAPFALRYLPNLNYLTRILGTYCC